jgi:hypothetical protein
MLKLFFCNRLYLYLFYHRSPSPPPVVNKDDELITMKREQPVGASNNSTATNLITDIRVNVNFILIFCIKK